MVITSRTSAAPRPRPQRAGLVVCTLVALTLIALGTPVAAATGPLHLAAGSPAPTTPHGRADSLPHGLPLGDHLDGEGRLLPSADGKTLDPAGFRLATTDDGSPRFVADDGAALPEGSWDDRFGRPGVDFGKIRAVAVNGSDLYVGGDFTSAAAQAPDDAYNHVAHWDGRRWKPMGSGTNDVVYALAAHGGSVYAAGRFDRAGSVDATGIARWDGSNWSSLGSGLTGTTFGEDGDGTGYALAVYGGRVIVGGEFRRAGGVGANSIAAWDGTTWAPLAGGVRLDAPADASPGIVYALAASATHLYAGGSFGTAGSATPANAIARWNGTTWSALGSGMTTLSGRGTVRAIVVTGADVYVGGSFAFAGGTAAANIARWNGTTWSALGAGLGSPGTVHAIAVHGGSVYAGGDFATAGGVPAAYFARWDGSAWAAVPTGTLNEPVQSLTSTPDGVAVSGLHRAGGLLLSQLGVWTGSQWRVFGQGIVLYDYEANVGGYGDVKAVAVTSTGDVYVGGQFTQAGDVLTRSVARWDGTRWQPLAGGVSNGAEHGIVETLALDASDNVYVGGIFTAAGGVAAKNIARWNGSSWSALGAGTDGPVYGLVRDGGTLFVGGRFSTAGPIAAWSMARYDLATGTWSRLHPVHQLGIGDIVRQFVVWGDWVFVGGQFGTFGGITTNSLVALNLVTGAYTDMGQGVRYNILQPGDIRALAVVGNRLYVGGDFGTAGDTLAGSPNQVAAPGLAAIDLASERWSLVGSPTISGGTCQCVRALEVVGDDLYVGGDFAAAGGLTARSIARFDTASETWASMGPGLVHHAKEGVGALDAHAGALVVGGMFSATNGVPASSITAVGLAPAPPPDPGAGFHALTPARILDTRPDKQIGLAGAFGPKQARVLKVTGSGGVPAGATAVMLNVTAVNPSEASFLSLVPQSLAPGQVPSTSSLNLTPGTVRPNLVLARLDASGRTTIYNNSGTVHVLADVVGWYDDGTPAGDRLTAVTPARILDTRPGPNQKGLLGTFGPKQARVLQVSGSGGVPIGATAAVLNVTSVSPTAESFLSLTPTLLGPGEVPSTSNLNLAAGQVRPNLVVVRLNSAGQISIYNNSGNVHVLADVVGYYASTGGGDLVHSVTPARILDTRPGPRQAGLAGPFGPKQARVLQVTGRGGVPEGAVAVWMNVTSVNPTAESFLSLTPSLGPAQVPSTSNLNLAIGQIAPNLVLVKLDPAGRVTIFNNSGTVDVIGDVVGYVA